MRRCGKSFLLFELFREHLLGEGVREDHLICLALDGARGTNIGGFLSPNKLARTFGSVKHVAISAPTIKQCLDLREEAFLMQRAERFDVRENRHIRSPSKYYFVDIGPRNVCINFRQPEESHIGYF